MTVLLDVLVRWAEELKRDIPNKYPQNMPQAASEVWQTWLTREESDLTSVPDHYDWQLDRLKTATRTAPPLSAAQLPNELRERETQAAPEVSVNLYSTTNSKDYLYLIACKIAGISTLV